MSYLEDKLEKYESYLITKLFLGRLGLAKTYWLALVLSFAILEGFMAVSAMADIPFLVILFMCAILLYLPLALVGTFKAANQYTGPIIWSVFAFLTVISGWVLWFGNLMIFYDLISL